VCTIRPRNVLEGKLDVITTIREQTMGRACSTHGKEEECMYDFDGKAGRKEPTMKMYV
jgi:hypothetical protein